MMAVNYRADAIAMAVRGTNGDRRMMRVKGARSGDVQMAMELAATRDVTKHPDFIEGVRATLVDKDHTPAWGEFAGEVDASAWA